MPIKVFSGDSTRFSSANLANGIYYAAENNASVINMSLGGTGKWDNCQAAINYAYGKGVISVASVGNDGINVDNSCPANLERVIAVGGVDTERTVNGTYPIMWTDGIKSNYGDDVDIWAPGRYIISTMNGGGWSPASGTSNSAPIVAGYIASLMTWRPAGTASAITPDNIVKILKSSAKIIDTATQAGLEDPPLPDVGKICVLDMYAAMCVSDDGTSIKEISSSDLVIFIQDGNLIIKSEFSVKKVEIYSLTGVLVISENNFNGNISVSTLPKEIYIVRVYTERGSVVRKIVVSG